MMLGRPRGIAIVFVLVLVLVKVVAATQESNVSGEQTVLSSNAVDKASEDKTAGKEVADAGKDKSQDKDIKEVESLLKKLSTTPPVSPMKSTPASHLPKSPVLPFTYIEEQYRPSFGDQVKQKLLPEGFYISNRLGRLVRGAGCWMFVFESQSKDSADSPVVILPNRWLEKMEADVLSTAEPIIFKVSGEITVYHGRNYLLLRKVLVERKTVGEE